MEKIVALQSVSKWLALTENWIYSQVAHLPSWVETHVVCDSVENLDAFPVRRAHVRSAAPKFWRNCNGALRRLPGGEGRDAFFEWAAKRSRAQVAHSHFGTEGWKNAASARKIGLKHVVTFYGYDISMLPGVKPEWRSRYERLFECADKILCEGPHMAGRAAALGCPEEKIAVHHLGVQLDQIPFRPRSWDGKGPLRALIAATFREKKGIPCALEALGRLKNDLQIEATVIGDATSEQDSLAEKMKILEVVDKFGLGGSVNFLGFLPLQEMREAALRCHIFLQPSVTASDGDAEGGAPVSILEMAASGMPVFAAEHCDIPEIIRHGATGLLAPERDAAGLAENIRWLAGRPDEWKKIAEAARRRIEEEFDAERQGLRLGEIYRRLVGA